MKSPESEPINAACPPKDELFAFLRGQLDEDKLETIAQHLTLCSACADGLRFLSSSDNFVQLVRRSVLSSSQTVETACLVLEERAREIPSRGTAMTTEIVGSADTVLEAPLLPLPFGGYMLLETLGEGGMGIVYKAKQESLNRIVALKRIRGGIYAGKEERERFQREGEVIASVEHPHVVKIHEFGELQGQPYFSMELLEGGTLSKKLKGQPLPEREAAELVKTLALTIAAAHRRGILHRDLKPSNVLFAGDGTPKISDFGLAKVMDNDRNVTRSDDVLGTPAYMSPEQARGEVRRLGPATDVYSLGAILYETLVGRPPFRGESRYHTLELVRTREPVSPHRHCPNVSRDLEAICLKCLEKKPEHRYSSGEELAADLERYLHGRSTQARPISAPRRLGRYFSRRPLTTSSVCLGFLLALTAMFLYHLHDPKNALETIQKRLRNGQDVDLLDKNGRPFYSQWESAKGILDVYEHEHAVSFAALEPTLVTLVFDPQNDYHFSAEVRHESTTQQSEVGLFFAYSRDQTSEGWQRCFAVFSFNDLEAYFPHPQTQRMCSRAVFHLQRISEMGLHSSNRDISVAYFDPANLTTPRDIPWRKLAVQCGREGFDLFWEDQMPVHISREQILNIFRAGNSKRLGTRMVPLFPELNPSYSSRDALGLYVAKGRASFRNVRVEPLSNR